MQEDQIIKTVKKVLPAVVSITMSKYLTVFEQPFTTSFPGLEQFFAIPKGKKKVEIGGGSGFIVDSSGLILTNRHVVEDPNAEYVVVLDEEEKVLAEILARDPINDIAILKIKKKNLPVVELGDSSKLQLGQTAIAIGNVLGKFRNTVSVGVISGLSRAIAAGSALTGETTLLRGLIQTDAAVNPGNSGGPLVNINGKAIGVNAAMVFGGENIGFALPINIAKRDLNEIKQYGKIRQPFLGIRYISLDKQLQKKYNLPIDHGSLVVSEATLEGEAVIKGSPADRAGIREGDIILECGQKKVSLKNPLQSILQQFEVGDEIELKILRNEKINIIKVILGEKR